MMTVAVCFLTAGTTSAGPAILWIATILLALIDCAIHARKQKEIIGRRRCQAIFIFVAINTADVLIKTDSEGMLEHY